MAANVEPALIAPTSGATLRPETLLVEALGGYRARLTYRALALRLVLVGAAIVAAPLLVIVADHLCPGGLPRPIMAAALIAWAAGTFGAVLAVVLLTIGRRLNLVFVARQLERVSQIHHNSVVNALLLRESAPLAYAEEAALRQAARDVATHEPSDALEPRAGRLPWIALLATVAAWMAYSTLAPKPVGPSLARFFGADREAPTATWLELARPRPEQAVHAGEALEFEFAVHGRAVRDVRLEILDADTDDAPVRREFVSSGSIGGTGDHRLFVLAPFEVLGDIHYRCTAGDARLAGRIHVEPQPDIESLSVVLLPPAYSGLPRSVASGPDLAVLVGTRAAFSFIANSAVCDPVLVFRGQRETRTRMTVDPDGPRGATLTLMLVESGTYRIEFSDPWAVAYRNPPEHRVDVRPDEPPTVRIVEPVSDEIPDDIVDLGSWAQLVAEARDDIGVGELTFVTQRPESVPRRLPVPLAEHSSRRRASGRVATAELALEAGQTMQAWFEVADGRVLPDGRSAPQVTRSRVLTLVRIPQPAAVERKPGEGDASDPDPGSEPGPDGDGAPNGDGESVAPDDDAQNANGDGEAGDGEPVDDPEGAESDSDGGAPGDSAPGEPDPDAPQEAGEQGGDAEPGDETPADGDLDSELEDFLEQHGREAEEAARRLREAEDADSQPDSQAQEERDGEQREGDADAENAEATEQGECDSGAEAGDKSPAQEGSDRESPSGAGESEGAGQESPPDQPPSDSDGPDSAEGSRQPDSTEAQGEQQDGQQGEQQGDQPDEGQGKQQGEQKGESSASGDSTLPEGAAGGQCDKPGNAGDQGGQGGPEDASGDVVPERNPPESGDTDAPRAFPPPSAADLPEATGLAEVLDLLEMLERGGKLTADMLIDLGWPSEKAADFLQDLQQLHERAKEAGGIGRLRRSAFDTRVGQQERQRGRGLSGGVHRELDPAELIRDALQRIAPPAEQHVPENLRALLDAYYRSLAAHRETE